MAQSDMLDNVLKKYELRDLYPKFERAGVVADIIWELDENMLSDSGLNAIEKHRYKKAKAKYDKRIQHQPSLHPLRHQDRASEMVTSALSTAV